MDSSYRHLAFLLSLGGVPLACAGGEDTTTDSASTGTTTASTTDTSSTTGTTDDTSTSTSGSTSTTGDTTGETTGDTTETGGPMTACESYAAKYVECFPRAMESEVAAACEESRAVLVENGEPGCGEAYDDLSACRGAATCEEFTGDQADICVEEREAMISACFGVGEVCEGYVAKHVECYGEADPFIGAACQMDVNYAAMNSPACGQAQEDIYACLNTLDCADFGDGTGCEAELENLDKACG